jgi:hypothetical protein
MRCPVCKADNAQGPQCRRCKADLSLLFALEEQRRRELASARRSLIAGDWQAALDRAEEADWLRADEESWRLAALSHLLGRNFDAAWHSYRNWRAAKKAESSSTK